ncbi:vacuolar protein sorting-associated protein 52 homolog [Folsomia candida]|uniref:vacuolar protein sorting-associated protein 52 homolog n=1 Tax=Folsomia candida TaxID=158441 RepID=UPI000B902FA2|nr:vacuolar protein sorting-associated protein 52 homolog [Folsomia candida]
MDAASLLEEVSPEIEHLVREALQSQGDLREYSKNIEKELREAENEAIKDYIHESVNIANLHNQIGDCDKILEDMEKMLLGFQGELGSLSSEIETLQKQSISMSVQLCNRQAVRGELSSFVDDMVVSDTLIRTILDTPATEPIFTDQLKILGQKAQFVNSVRDTKAAKDVADVIEKLTVRATAKVREYLLQQTYKFRKPVTNYQIPQNGLLKHKFFFEFLLKNERQVAKEIKDEYIDTMSKVYYSYFKTYAARLAKKQTSETATKDHVLAAAEEVKGKNPLFSLGSRADLLNDLEAPALVPHAWNGPPLPYEALFRSLIFTLVDNACREYLFLGDFFMVKTTILMDLFHQVMGKTLGQLLSVVDEGTSNSWDGIGLLLCAHIVLRLQMVTHKRAVPALDHLFSAALDYIWPAFDRALSANAFSLKGCETMPTDLMPHYITRRYAELSSGLAVIDAGFPQERVRKSLLWLAEEMEPNLIRMASAFQERSKQLVFLINNFDLILSVHMEKGQEPKESDRFRVSLNKKTAEYAEETLSPHFGTLIQFVREAENMIQGNHSQLLAKEEARVSAIIINFGATWKQAIDSVNREVMSSFPSFRTGATVLQQALTLLIQYYHRFQKILADHMPSLTSRQDLVNIHQLMVEVKKYKPNF